MPPLEPINPGNQLTGECRTYSAQIDTHAHPYGQLLLPLQGQLCITTTAATLVLDESRLLYLPPGCQHSFFAPATNQFLVLDIPPAYLHRSSLAVGAPWQPRSLDPQWQALRQLLQAELEAPGPGLHHLASYALARLQQTVQPRSQQYIHSHYDQPLTLAALAQLEGYTVGYFCEWFKQLTGQTPHAYLQQLRLEQAQRFWRWPRPSATSMGPPSAGCSASALGSRLSSTASAAASLRRSVNAPLNFG
jgi:AraC-like DNA-binding protein